MRAQLQRDALPRQRDKHSSSSSRSKRASASETDAKQHGNNLNCLVYRSRPENAKKIPNCNKMYDLTVF